MHGGDHQPVSVQSTACGRRQADFDEQNGKWHTTSDHQQRHLRLIGKRTDPLCWQREMAYTCSKYTMQSRHARQRHYFYINRLPTIRCIRSDRYSRFFREPTPLLCYFTTSDWHKTGAGRDLALHVYCTYILERARVLQHYIAKAQGWSRSHVVANKRAQLSSSSSSSRHPVVPLACPATESTPCPALPRTRRRDDTTQW